MYVRKQRSPTGGPDPAANANIALGYLYRYVEEEINRIAAQPGAGTTAADLATRLAALLRHKAEWTLLDGGERLQEVRRGSAQGHEKRPAKKALHVRARDGRPLKPRPGRRHTLQQRMYARMQHRLHHSKNPQLRARAAAWFKRNHPDSVQLKRTARAA